jgi:membrane protease YdiL (CAAX protease family)
MNLEEDNPLPPQPAEPAPHSFCTPDTPADPDYGAVQFSSAGFATSSSALPEDVRVPWGWSDVALLAVLAFGLTFLFLIVILLVLAPFGLKLSQLQNSTNQWGLIVVSSQILTDLAMLAYLAAQVRLRFRFPFWRTIGWRPIQTPISRGGTVAVLICIGIFLAALVTIASNAAPPKETLPIEKILEFPPTAILFMLTAVLVAPVVEETIFRGYLYPVAARSLGVVSGIILTGTLFGLLHSLQLWGGWWQIALLVVVGIVFTAARAITRSVMASWVLHISYNSIQVAVMAVSMIGPHHLPRLH